MAKTEKVVGERYLDPAEKSTPPSRQTIKSKKGKIGDNQSPSDYAKHCRDM